MKFNKIPVSWGKSLGQFFCVYLTFVGFHELGQPIFSLAAPTMTTTAPYVRKSRDTAGLSPTSSPEGMDGQEQYLRSSSLPSSNSGFFPYPSFKHKYPAKMTRFHGDYPSSSGLSIRSMTSFPKLNPLGGILSGKSNEVLYPSGTGMRHSSDNLFEGEEQDPTFTPFISARALSNIPQFFQHLRDNLEALQLDDEDEDEDSSSIANEKFLGHSADGMYNFFGNDDEGRFIQIPHPPEKTMRWRPPTAGMSGRAQIRHFVKDPADQDLFIKKPTNYIPTRNAYEFGLG